MPEIRNFMTSQDWGPHHDVKLLDMMEMESLKMEIGNFKLIKIAFKCWEAAQNKTGPYFGGQSYLEDNKVAMKMGGPKVGSNVARMCADMMAGHQPLEEEGAGVGGGTTSWN